MMALLNVKITPFQLADTQQLSSVIDSVCADTGWMQTTRFKPTPAWQHALENESCLHHLLAVARMNGQVIGWCRLFPLVDEQSGPVELGIGVLRPYRHRGVGTVLMAYGLDWTKCKDIPEIVLTTHEHNVPAMGLFWKFGFEELSRSGALLRMGLEV
jgi:ribosomal protein S18 acetylase RimI-like enzyme